MNPSRQTGGMPQRETDEGLNLDALRRAIERRDPDLVLGFYAEDARLSIIDARAPRSSRPFELRGKPEIAKHLRAVYGQKASHRVERGTVDEDLVTFREVCEYPDGSRVIVETTLEVRDGRIVRQKDVVAKDARAGAAQPDLLPKPEHTAKEEDCR